MKAACVCVFAGLALGSVCEAQVRPELQTLGYSGQQYRARTVTAIVGLTTDGLYVLGETIAIGEGNTGRTLGVIAYDAAQLADTNGDGFDLEPVCADVLPHTMSFPGDRYWFGIGYSWQSFAEDIVVEPGTEGGILSEVAFGGVSPGCEQSLEPLFALFESWEGFDNFPHFDGSDGFSITPVPGGQYAFPADLSDNDGDTFVDNFLGGVIMDFNNVDLDGDTIPDVYSPQGGFGYGIFSASALDSLAVPLTDDLDLFNGGLPGADGRGDGGIRLLWTRGTGGDGLGPLSGFYPSSKAQSMLWGTLSMQRVPSACVTTYGFGAGDSTGTVWGEGEDICEDGLGAWSENAPTGNELVDNLYDNAWDIGSLGDGIVPDFESLGLMIRINVNGDELPPTDCCDVNLDNQCSPADFTAWIAAFNGQVSPCDINQDGGCTPADFSAWIAAFNASMNGTPSQCVF